MLKAFEYYVEHAKKPNVLIFVNAINDNECCRWQEIDVTNENFGLIKECLITQEWYKVFSKAPDIDFDKLKTTNGNYKPYDVFILDYCV